MHQEQFQDISTRINPPIKGAATSTKQDESQFSGYLKIRHKRFGRRWKRRYVIIYNTSLYVYSNENATNVKEYYSICDIERVTVNENNDKFKLTFREAKTPALVCSCKTSKERMEWVTRIKTAISFGGDSGFKGGEMLQHKTAGRSQSKYDVDEDSGCFDPFSESSKVERKYEPVRYSKGTRLGLQRIESSPSIIATENMTIDSGEKNVRNLSVSDDERSLGSLERYWIGSPSLLRTKSLPSMRTDTWYNCFKYRRNFEENAKKLLRKGMLPDDTLLQNIYKMYGRRSGIIRSITNVICQNIKEQSKDIVHVWPAFQYRNNLKYNENHLIFVVITETQTDIETDYQIYERNVNKILSVSEKENYSIRNCENFSDVRINDIKLCLKSNASKLMETHKNLTWVTICSVKSSGYGSVKSSGYGRKSEIVKSLCIALYVQVKGFIPIDEDPFEQFIDGFPVDVREGVFTLCGSPTDLHDNVRMGCALDSGFGTNQGTIGPFFRYETDSFTYLLTSAHVLLNHEEMQRLIADKEVHYGMYGTNTYQPPESISGEKTKGNSLGKLEFAVYRQGEQYKSGMEVALVRINENRIPIDGKFPSKSGETGDVLEFAVVDICSYNTLLNDTYVYKYGSVTGLTKGRVRLQGSSVQTSILYGKYLGLDITMHNQIEIESVDGAFGEQGDSGSLVFKMEGNKLVAVGIFEGKNNDIYMVTPICDVKQALSEFMSRYRNPPIDAQMDVDEQNSAVTLKLCYVTGINRNISDEISRQTTKIQTDILHYTDHKIDSVKTELKIVKAQIDANKQEIMDHMSSQISELARAIRGDRLQMQSE